MLVEGKMRELRCRHCGCFLCEVETQDAHIRFHCPRCNRDIDLTIETIKEVKTTSQPEAAKK